MQRTLKNTRNTLKVNTQMDWELNTHTPLLHGWKCQRMQIPRSAFRARTPSRSHMRAAAQLPWRQELHPINMQLINANEAHARACISPVTASYSRTIMRTEI